MKHRKLVLVILLLLVIVLVFSWAMFHKRYNLKLINKFTIQGITLKSQHKILDGYAVSFALSDSLIYVTDASDTTHTKSFCYNYSGQPFTGFQFPTDKGYGEIFVDKNLYFLPQSNMLAYNHWEKQQIDYYSTNGTFIRSDIPIEDQNINIYNIAEYGHSQYFNVMGNFIDGSTSSIRTIRLYKAQSNQAPVVFKNINISTRDFKNHISLRMIMIDDNGKDEMAVFERDQDKQRVIIYNKNDSISFNIPPLYRFSFQFKKVPYQLVLGKDFVLLGNWKKDLLYPLQQRIYNLKGRYLGRLVFKDDPQNELIDIIGDKLVAFNPAKGVVSIYSISLR